jgi:predicted TPR repeat methyltransferase
MSSLLKGIGNSHSVRKYYDLWSSEYDQSLHQWDYRAPKQSVKILAQFIKRKPKYLLDLACGTGLFTEELLKEFPDCICDGSDISPKIINISKNKKIYRKLFQSNFEKRIAVKSKYNIVSLIGAMTYCQDHQKLFQNVSSYLEDKGYFIFTHRLDLWEKFDFDNIINNNSQFRLLYKSRPINYLPKNKDFTSKIKIRIVLLTK